MCYNWQSVIASKTKGGAVGIMKKGFDHEIYIERQSKYILERVKGWDKLYLEFGGKLMYDLHAKRCLPGYRENAKLELLQSLGGQGKGGLLIEINQRGVWRPDCHFSGCDLPKAGKTH